MSGKKTWIAASILCGTMVIGIGIGSAGTLLVLKSAFKNRRPTPSNNLEMRKEPIKDFFLRRMESKLDLSEEQVELVREELDLMANDFKNYHESVRISIDEITTRADEAIKKHLTEEQVVLFEEEFVNKRKFGGPGDRDRRNKDWERRDGPMGPHPDGGFGPPPGDMGPPPDWDFPPPPNPEKDG